MASFTDEILKFNPYVQQLPVELMMKVGMQKQAQYDAGVQKAQTYIDNIAGLDVANNVDKAYLQSKLGELGGKLKLFASADFSNQQLVNTVGGMTKELIVDPTIQQAVASTQMYKKGTSQLNDDIAKGKAKAHTTWLFTQEADKYLNSNKAGTVFNARYQPPTADPTKKALEAIKALHPNLQNIQDPYEIINGIRTGKLASVMKEYKIEGITEGQIATAISAVLDADDIRDLDIQGMYQFRNLTPDRLAEYATTNYNSKREQYEKELEILKKQKAISTSNPELANNIDKRIEYYEKQLGEDGKLRQSYNEDLANAMLNPEGVKANIYRKGFIDSFANAFKWSSTTEEFVDSPFEEVRQFNERLAFDKEKEARDRIEFDRSYQLDLRKQLFEEKKYEEEQSGEDMNWVSLGLDVSNNRDAVNVYEGIMQDHADAAASSLGQLKNAGYDDKQISQMVNDYKKYGNKAKIEPDAIGSIQEYLRESSKFKTLEEDLKSYKEKAETVALEDHPEWKGKKQIGTYNPRTRKVEYDNIDILHQLATGKAKLNVDRAIAGQIRLQFTREDGSKGLYEIDKNAGGAEFVGAKELRPILLTMYEKNKIYGENLADMLAPYATELTGRVKAVKAGKSGELPANIARNLASHVYATKQMNIAANSDYDPDIAAQLLDSKNVKDTRVMLYNRGNDYEIVMNSLTGAAPDQRIKVDASQARALLGDKYVEQNASDVLLANLAKKKSSRLNDPENAIMQAQYGDFPNIQKLQVTASLKEDTKDKGLYIPVINILKKDGKYQQFTIAGRNNMQRLGYDQGKAKLQGLTDEQLISLIRENYPTYDINLLDID